MEHIYKIQGYHLLNSHSDKVLFVCLIRVMETPGSEDAAAGIFIRAWGRRGQDLQSKVEKGAIATMNMKLWRYGSAKKDEGYVPVDWTNPVYHIAKSAVLLHPLINEKWQQTQDYTTGTVGTSVQPAATPPRTKKQPAAQPAAPPPDPFSWQGDSAAWIEQDDG